MGIVDVRFMMLHTALESMICATPEGNRQQIITRLPAIFGGGAGLSIFKKQADRIYKLNNSLKHSAAPFDRSITADAGLEGRLEDASLLERAVRELLKRVVDDRTFADVISNPSKLQEQYPVKPPESYEELRRRISLLETENEKLKRNHTD